MINGTVLGERQIIPSSRLKVINKRQITLKSPFKIHLPQAAYLPVSELKMQAHPAGFLSQIYPVNIFLLYQTGENHITNYLVLH